ncbi:glycosyltransferase [Kitasatospora sp. NBC_01287]|uniref:glycosyltransferase family 2 protein n=1 Tax=Kitasatospora sp. NBC_01287 TaxID=2903573 RepID=UPI002256D041|nr:glycosyltransferase family 2 protein [Kitasatospora sp. NBC_01287]MCX4745364.1 glycosyltransferase [Kitasatospora sp. NBC_01287]
MPPLLSIILPVHGVEQFLPRCLDSILAGQESEDVEVIAVDDRSPDGCGAILDDYAARDKRLRVLHLSENQGLGGARIAALPEAHGSYLWCVDSDDWLPEGALDAVLAELRAERDAERAGERAGEPPLDILLTGFTHVYPDGSTEPNPWRHLLAGSPLERPAGCTLREHPALLRTVLSVWNKVFRREFLDGLQVSFGRGFYEDLSVTYPALLAARRLRYLDRSCYNYRRGRPGAITATASPKHADVFAQYDAVFAFLDRHPDLADQRTLVFDRTLKQALTVYDSPGLVPAELSRDFFHRIAAHFAAHRPPGYHYPGGVQGVRYRLAARDARLGYDELRRAGRLPRALKASLRRGRG